MKRNWTVPALILAFVVVVGGAALLYRSLAGDTSATLTAEPGAGEPAATATPEPDSSSEATPDPDSGNTGEDAREERIEAPDFTVYDGQDEPVQLSGFEGKPVILNFWASWCGPCQSEMPDFEDAYAQYGEEIHFVMVNATYGRETRADADDFIAENGYTFPIYYDTDYSAAAAFGVTGYPTTYFIDGEGYLVAYAQGALDAEVLQKGIDMLGVEAE